MSIVVDPIVEVQSLGSLLGVTRQELADGLKEPMLVKAAKDEGGKLTALFSSIDSESIRLQIADHLNAAVDIDPVEIFAGAWVKYSELKACANETLKEQGSSQDVGLAEHEFSYQLKTTLDLVFDGARISSIPLQFEISCEVSGLELFLRKGCVYEVHSGELSWKAAFECAGEEIWSRPLAHLHLPGVLHLRKPIPISS